MQYTILQKENDFDYTAGNELKSILFKGTVLAQPSAGTIESVKGIKLSDVQEFVQKHLTISNLIVVLGGDIDFEAGLIHVRRALAKNSTNDYTKTYQSMRTVPMLDHGKSELS